MVTTFDHNNKNTIIFQRTRDFGWTAAQAGKSLKERALHFAPMRLVRSEIRSRETSNTNLPE